MKTWKTLPDGTEIVEYENSLAPAVAEMWNRSGEGWGGSFGAGVWTADQVITKHAVGSYFNVYIAMKDGEALGYCSFNRYFRDANTAYVDLLNVRPDYHGKKIGKELVLMCVNETIARHMPRLDIHTWPGNTKSVPLYKKCGFCWEDRSDTTHLSNFIPTVLSTELIRDYFQKADWYSDSTRQIVVKPDGVTVDKFETFEYSWLKDGESLRVWFEKTGRRIRCIETDDYRIEMTAQHHELAFGLSYNCRFDVVNKTGKELSVQINGRNDDVIHFDGAWEESVTGASSFSGTFFVNPITEAIDELRMHPCLLADVSVNGKHAEFGLGIEPKFPVSVTLVEKWQVAKPGMSDDVFINIKNALPEDADVCFTIPENRLTRFEQTTFNVKLVKGKDVSLAVKAHITCCGYECLPVAYDIRTNSGESVSLTLPLHLVNQGLSGQFAFGTDDSSGAANGMWRLYMNKQNNAVYVRSLLATGEVTFLVPRFGKPYDDEFNIMKPADIRVATDSADSALITFEADFVSRKFAGAVLTERFTLSATGVVKYHFIVKNAGTAPVELALKSTVFTSAGASGVIHYNGDFHNSADVLTYGYDNIEQDKIDENWIFSAVEDNPVGFCWPAEYKPSVEWGDDLQFLIPVGRLAPGEVFETKSFEYIKGLFRDFREFRNYVLGINDESVPFTHNHLEYITNGGNPVLRNDSLQLELRNNRSKTYDGTVTVSSPDGLFATVERVLPSDEVSPVTAFGLPVMRSTHGIGFADYALRFTTFEKDVRRALLIADNSQVKTEENDGVLTVVNGKLVFSVSPSYSDAVYSLRFGQDEWLFSRYPSLEPYAWWNPFIGGLKSYLRNMGNSMVVRENITASFVTEKDSSGNVWTGISATVNIEKYDEYKGIRYTQYYLTLPGVPVLCHFARLENGTGKYLRVNLSSELYHCGIDGLTDQYAAGTTENNESYRLRMGVEDREARFDRLITISNEHESARSEKMFIYKDSKRDHGSSMVICDRSAAFCEFLMKGNTPDGGLHTTKPLFCLITDKNLTLESLEDLSRITF